MLVKHCFEKDDKSHLECVTHNKKLFRCHCCDSKELNDCSKEFYKNAMDFSENHQSLELDSYEYDYQTDYEDQLDPNYVFPSEEHKLVDDVNITDISHLFNECKERKYLPVHCYVNKNNQTMTICDCISTISNNAIDETFFNSSDLWTNHPCNVTSEYYAIEHYGIALHNMFLLCMSILILFIISVIGWFCIKKLTKYKKEARLDDELSLIYTD